MSLKSKLKKRRKTKKELGPAWKGPEVDGVTQSLLSRFLCCTERFRVYAIEGYQSQVGFVPAIEYGQMWHICEEALAQNKDWRAPLKDYAIKIAAQYPAEQTQIAKWYEVCKRQFPHYIKYWEDDKDTKRRTPIYQERVFRIPYELPSGRIVFLRGKWDAVDLIGTAKGGGVYLQENKSKGVIDEEFLERQLKFDLQSMVYLTALSFDNCLPTKVKGVRYNVIRRPLSGGVGSIRKRKATKNKPAETDDQYYSRLEQYFIDDPSHWFKRWKVEVLSSDLKHFQQVFLNPCLEHLCQWYDHVTGKADNPHLNYRLPYGVYNSILEGRNTELEEYLDTGSTLGLCKVNSLFGEL